MRISSLFFHEDLLEQGIKAPVPLNLSAPHLAVFGSSGSGKTYCSKLLLAKAVKHLKASLLVGDYKGDRDFEFLLTQESFFRFDKVSAWFDEAIGLLENRQSRKDRSRALVIAYLDEMAAYLTMLDKQGREIRIRQLSRLLMLGRSFNIHVWISQQRPDSEYFGKSRENIHNSILLGSFSKEVLGMLLSDDQNEVSRKQGRGRGYLIEQGKPPIHIRVPTYDIFAVEEEILKGMYSKKEVAPP
ncbi:type IV secretory system conjugative DNA transfer family protein [Streptococcus pneumoniae]